MNSRLEQFIHDHREEFDGEEPDKKVWEKIRQQTEPGKKKQAPLVRLYRVRWSAAAAVILLIAGAAWWYTNTRQGNGQPAQPSIASQSPKPATVDTATTQHPDIAAQEPSHTPVITNPGKSPVTGPKGSPDNTANNDMDASVNEEMYHYARLVELKHKELKTIEKDEPLLYRQFASDVNKLDSVYHSLQGQLPTNPNREQILEAMLQNLQLQMGLLNHQLDIIKQINHSKKTAYEKAYKTA
jgi:hypothetical protein